VSVPVPVPDYFGIDQMGCVILYIYLYILHNNLSTLFNMSTPTHKQTSSFQDFIPKLWLCMREGYSWDFFLKDLLAGVTVGVIALPLALAFAIGSGVAPEKGLYTAIVAGFLISLLGGSRVQISGPTGAFVVIVYSIVQRQGYDGLAMATLLAGGMLIVMGLARSGVLLRFVPYPVITGFTTGIALVIFSSQIKDFFGLSIPHLPTDFLDKWKTYYACCHTWNVWDLTFALSSLGTVFFFKYYLPKIPGTIIAIILATFFVSYFELPLETIETRFSQIPDALPTITFPTFTFKKALAVFPDAITITLLASIESLLSAAVADGMTGNRHRSNCELVAQGIGNIGSILFGGIPATGAIARTGANIKLGAKTPISGLIHSATLLLLMLVLSPIASKIPLASLSAILVFVAWNMSELPHFFSILKGTKSDASILIVTFLLTVLVDLTIAVPVGVFMAVLVKQMHRLKKNEANV
jgi:SulP family sulfate permease